jgi:hypothetical protein
MDVIGVNLPRNPGGLLHEKDYKYTQENGYCVYDKGMRQKTGAVVKRFVKVPEGVMHAAVMSGTHAQRGRGYMRVEGNWRE